MKTIFFTLCATNVYNNFLSRLEEKNDKDEVVGGLLYEQECSAESEKQIITEAVKTYPARDDFIHYFSKILDGEIGNSIPYIKNASPDKKTEFAGKVWHYLQSRMTDEITKRR